MKRYVSRRIVVVAILAGIIGIANGAETTKTVRASKLSTEPIAMAPTAVQAAAMGDWEGKSKDGTVMAAQVLAFEGGKYSANLLKEFDSAEKPLAVINGTEQGGKVVFDGEAYKGTIDGSHFTVEKKAGNPSPIEMKKKKRISPTMGAKPPKGATVLFDGKSLDNWQRADGKPALWKLTGDGAMKVVWKSQSIETKEKFKDARYHIEFRTPFMPAARGQKRGNSGVYIQGCYEVQVLDSYGLEAKDNECGGIYKVGTPRVNMCAPPLQWQTYDITFHAARFDESGKKTANARISVDQNGVSIHKNLEIPGPTGGAKSKGDPEDGGPLVLQEHGGDPVQYRNIWVVELPAEKKQAD